MYLNNISIKSFFYVVVIGEILFFLLFGNQFIKLNKIFKKNEESEKLAFMMEDKADRLSGRSQDLTRFARAYSFSADKKHLNNFYQILDIQSGKIPRPTKYENDYWLLPVQHTQENNSIGVKISLIDLIKKLPFTPEALTLAEEIIENSNKLVELDKEAINMVDGKFKDDKGLYSILGESNKEYAQNLLYSKKYIVQKEEIMLKVHLFWEQIKNRLKLKHKKLILEEEEIIKILTTIFIIFLLFNIIILIIIIRKIINPITTLNDKMNDYSNGEIINFKRFTSDEIGRLCKSFATLIDKVKHHTQSLEKANKLIEKERYLLSSILNNTIATDKLDFIIAINLLKEYELCIRQPVYSTVLYN